MTKILYDLVIPYGIEKDIALEICEKLVKETGLCIDLIETKPSRIFSEPSFIWPF